MSKKQAFSYFVHFSVDPDASFEECNGEARPLTEAEYRENQYMGCPNGHHGPSYTDPPNSGIGYCGICRAKFQPVSYADYRRYYGNPDRHVYLQTTIQRKCPCCERVETLPGTGSIDFMDDAPELTHVGKWISAWDIEARKDLGYLREIALEDLENAGYEPSRVAYCAVKGCKYICSDESRYCAQHQHQRSA